MKRSAVTAAALMVLTLAGCDGQSPGPAGNRQPIFNGDGLPIVDAMGIVSFEMQLPGGRVALGSGVLLTNEWVLTASHVFDLNRDPGAWTVHLTGRLDNQTGFRTDDQTSDVAQLIFHPLGVRVDVALARLVKPFTLFGKDTGYTTSIFAGDVPSKVNQTCFTYGYGVGKPGDAGVNTGGVFRWAEFPIIAAPKPPSPPLPEGDPSPLLNVYFQTGQGISLAGQPTLVLDGDSGGPCYNDGQIIGITHGTSDKKAGPTATNFHVTAEVFRDWVARVTSQAGAHDFKGGDDEADLLFRNVNDGSGLVWRMSFTSGQPIKLSDEAGPPIPTNPGIRVVGTGDFNGDHRPDVVYVSDDNPLAIFPVVLLSDPSSPNGFSSAPTWAFPRFAGWDLVAVGDVTGDGIPDFIWRSSMTGENLVWAMADFSGPAKSDFTRTVLGDFFLPPEIDQSWQIAGVADFDRVSTDVDMSLIGSGKDPRIRSHDRLEADILWRRNTGENRVWYLEATPSGVGVRRVEAIDSQPAENTVGAIADLDHDGIPDIVWRDETNGAITVWAMSKQQAPASSGSADLLENGTLQKQLVQIDCNSATTPCVFNLAFKLVGP